MHIKRKTRKIKIIIPIILILLGVLIFIYPMISNYVIKKEHIILINSYDKNVKDKKENYISEELLKAKIYNENLIGENDIKNPFTDGEDFKASDEYNNILNVDGTGIMGYIEIPKIDVKLPIYHGTGDNILKRGVGHIEETSLPVGGLSTHAVLASHTGLSKAKMFDNIDKLENGDYFNIHVLENTLTYKVIDKKVVLPNEISSLLINKNEDLVTLVTCTPKYINTHRLLVTGTRANQIEFAKLKENYKIEESFEIIDNKKRIFIGVIILVFWIDLFFVIFKLFRVLPLK